MMCRYLLQCLLMVGLLGLATTALASEAGASTAWHSTWLLEALGIALAIVAAALLWLLRKILASGIHIVVLILSALLLLAAVWGRSLGVYDWLLGTDYASTSASVSQQDVETETYDERHPSFEEFFQDL